MKEHTSDERKMHALPALPTLTLTIARIAAYAQLHMYHTTPELRRPRTWKSNAFTEGDAHLSGRETAMCPSFFLCSGDW